MTGLPRKYAKMGFKKGWRLFKQSKNTKSPVSKKPRSVPSMAKRRRSSSRSFSRGARKFYRRNKSGLGLAGVVIAGAIYGAGRSYVSNMISPLTAKIPAGQYADNIAMLGVAYGLKRFGRIPILKQVGMHGLAIEGALLGSEIMQAQTSTSSATTGGKLF